MGVRTFQSASRQAFIARVRASQAAQAARRQQTLAATRGRETLRSKFERLGTQTTYEQYQSLSPEQRGDFLSSLVQRGSITQEDLPSFSQGEQQFILAEQQQQRQEAQRTQILAQKRAEQLKAAQERAKIERENAARNIEEYKQGFNVSLRTGEIGRAETIAGKQILVYKSADPTTASITGAQLTPEYIQTREQLSREFLEPYNVSLSTGAVARVDEKGRVEALASDLGIATPSPITTKEIKRGKAIAKERAINDRVTRAIGAGSRFIDNSYIGSLVLDTKKTKKLPYTKVEAKELALGFGRTIASPFIGAGKVVKTTFYEYPKYLLGKSPQYKPLKGDPDVGSLAVNSLFGAGLLLPYTRPIVSNLINPIALYGAYKSTKEGRSPYELGEALAVGTGAVLSSPPLIKSGKGFLQRVGKQKIAPEKVFDPDVLAGRKTLPTVKNIRESEIAFAKAGGEVATAAPQRLTGDVAGVGKRAATGSEDPGIYVAPRGRGSPHFLRTVPISEESTSISFNPFAGFKGLFKTPTVTEFKTAGVKRYPREIIQQKGFKPIKQFQEQQAGSGFVFITKRSEIGLGAIKGKGEAGTREVEAVIPVGQRFVEKPSKLYTTFRGSFVRLRKAKLVREKYPVIPSGRELTFGKIRSEQEYLSSLGKEKVPIKPVYYFDASRRSQPRYNIDYYSLGKSSYLRNLRRVSKQRYSRDVIQRYNLGAYLGSEIKIYREPTITYKTSFPEYTSPYTPPLPIPPYYQFPKKDIPTIFIPPALTRRRFPFDSEDKETKIKKKKKVRQIESMLFPSIAGQLLEIEASALASRAATKLGGSLGFEIRPLGFLKKPRKMERKVTKEITEKTTTKFSTRTGLQEFRERSVAYSYSKSKAKKGGFGSRIPIQIFPKPNFRRILNPQPTRKELRARAADKYLKKLKRSFAFNTNSRLIGGFL